MKKISSAIVFTFALLFSSELFAEAWSSANPERYNKMGFDNALWVETFEGNEKPFTVEYIGGAEGTAKVVDNGGRNGTPLYGNGGHLMESQPKTPPKDPQLFIRPSMDVRYGSNGQWSAALPCRHRI